MKTLNALHPIIVLLGIVAAPLIYHFGLAHLEIRPQFTSEYQLVIGAFLMGAGVYLALITIRFSTHMFFRILATIMALYLIGVTLLVVLEVLIYGSF